VSTYFVCVAGRRHRVTEGHFQHVSIEYWPTCCCLCEILPASDA